MYCDKISNESVGVLDIRNNSFNFLRLVAALNVFYFHALTHLKIQGPHTINLILGLFQGVPIFFILSGFLIWGSIERSSSFKDFLEKRILRLYPELGGGVLLNAITMMLLYGESIEPISFILFNIAQVTLFQFWTPSSLRGYGVGTPNGALWTIGPMVQAYLVLWVVYGRLHGADVKRWVAALSGSVMIGLVMPLLQPIYPNEIIFKLTMQTFLPYFWLFLLGAVLFENFNKIIGILMRYWALFFLCSGTFVISGIDVGYYPLGKCIFLAPAIVGFAYKFNNLSIKHDISYELYLSHMIVINAMVQLGYRGRPIYFFVALLLSLVVATVSYVSIGALSRSIKARLG